MDDLPPLPSSAAPSRASSRQSSSPVLSETHLYIRDFVCETRQRLHFTSTQLPILDDNQLTELLDGETILLPLCCAALNALASMTRQLDTITTQLGNIQSVVATLPTVPGLEGGLAPINASLRDLSQRVAAAPYPQAPAPTRPSVPPTGATTHPMPLLPQVRTKARAPPPHKSTPSSFDPDIPRYDPDTRSFYGNRRSYADKFPDSWEANAFREGKYPNPTTFIAGHLAPDCPKPQPSYAQAANAGARRVRRIRALTRPLKSRQQATPSLFPRDQSRSRLLRGDSTLPVPPPPSTHKPP